MSSRDSIKASSATYRKATNMVAGAIRVPPIHTAIPSADFEAIADLIDRKSRKRALKWYGRGIRRGIIETCNAILDGRLEFRDGALYCPSKVIVSRKVRFRGRTSKERRFEFRAEDLEFK